MSIWKSINLLAILLILMLVSQLAFAITPGTVIRVSTGSQGQQADNINYDAAISADGRYVAFASFASNLVEDDINTQGDIFVKDTRTGSIARVSTSSDGQESDSTSFNPSISANGRYVVFESYAENLVNDDNNGRSDVFLKDTLMGTTTRVSTDWQGQQVNDHSYNPSISADGRYIVFESQASSLVAGDSNGSTDIFRRDMADSTEQAVIMVSTDSQGGQADRDSYEPKISANGNYVAFESTATDLVEGDTNGKRDIFRKNISTGAITRISTGSQGEESNAASDYPAISANGRYIVFRSEASNLVNGDNNGEQDIFRKDATTGVITRVSTGAESEEADDESWSASISSDGRYVVFTSLATNLIGGDTNGVSDVYLKDMRTGGILRLSVSSDGEQAVNDSEISSISSDGHSIVFLSNAENIVANDDNFNTDVFLHQLTPATALSTKPALANGNNGWYKTVPTITLTRSGTGITRYRWGTSGSWITYTAPLYAKKGINTLQYYSFNGGDSEPVKSKKYKVDNTKPRTGQTLKTSVKRYGKTTLRWKVADAYTNNKAFVTIKIKKSSKTYKTINVNDGKLTTINKTRYQPYTAKLPKGTYKYYIYTTDQAGNKQYNVASNYLVIR